jgi:hypothetical protein
MLIDHVTATAPTIEQLLDREDTSRIYSPCYGYVQRRNGGFEWTMSHPPKAFRDHRDYNMGVGEYFYLLMCATDFSSYPHDAAADLVGWMWISQGWMAECRTEEELEHVRPSSDPQRRHVEISLYLDHRTGTVHHRYAPEGQPPTIEELPYPAGGWGGSRGAVLAGMDHMRLEILKTAP